MRIPLEEALAELTRGDDAPAPATAEQLLTGATPAPRHLLPLLTGVLAVVAAVVLLPRHGQGSDNPSRAFTWTGRDPGQTGFDDQEVARRCPLAFGQRYSIADQDLVAGGTVDIITEGSSSAGEQCTLGYEFAPSHQTVTQAQATASGEQLVQACSQQSGLDLAGRGWQLVSSAHTRDDMAWNTTVAGFLWTGDDAKEPRWLATCKLVEGHDGTLDLLDLAMATTQSLRTCPNLLSNFSLDEADTTGNSVSSLELETAAPVTTANGLSLDTRVRLVELQVKGTRQVARVPVTDGIAVAATRLVFSPSVQAQGSDMVPVVVRLLDASGKQLRTCGTGS